MEQTGDTILVAATPDAAMVRVNGRGSFKSGPALKQFGRSCIEKGCRRIVVDLKDCVGMDSTFMGVLAGLAAALKKKEGGILAAINLTPKNLSLLETLGLTSMIKTCPPGAESDQLATGTGATPVQLDSSGIDKRTTTATMLDAHETLVGVSPANLPKFKNVLEYLREDLQKQDQATDKRL